MSLYQREDERRIRVRALVREWARSGLLDASQAAAIEAEVRVDVRRTNVFLRAGLALFTILIVSASVLFAVEVLRFDRPVPFGVVAAVFSVACLALAHYLVVRQRFYRFGVEEALAVGSVALLSTSAAAFTYALDSLRYGDASFIAALATGAAGGVALYFRFGYVYAAVGALACVAAIPFQLDLSPAMQHALAGAALGVALLGARAQRVRYQDEYPGDDYALIQAAACAGVYLSLNLQLASSPDAGLFYWFTYVAIWALPSAGLYLAIRDKDRPLLAVSLVMALVTLVTNKPYLGWERHEWDAILFGATLMAAAVGVRRWLSTGPDGQRAGFTPARILRKDAGAVTILGNASVRFHPDAAPMAEPGAPGFDGGRSGGGGATGSY